MKKIVKDFFYRFYTDLDGWAYIFYAFLIFLVFFLFALLTGFYGLAWIGVVIQINLTLIGRTIFDNLNREK